MQDRFTAKKLSVIEEPGATTPGIGQFLFTDSYSVFDYGVMPDELPGKGEAMCQMAAYNLRLLETHGVPTHFRQSVARNRIEFDLLNVYDPAVRPIPPDSRAYFIPLQIVFRNSLPAGASLLKRLHSGEATLKDLGWTRIPEPGEPLDKPLIEYMTKLENLDRFISKSYAQQLSSLTASQLDRIEELVLRSNQILTKHAEEVGLLLADAKLEFGIDAEGLPLLADVAGTPDETRFILDGHHISKQVLRVLNSGSDFRERVHAWANQGRSPADKPIAPRLSKPSIDLASNIYRSLSERWIEGHERSAVKLESLLPQLAEFGLTA